MSTTDSLDRLQITQGTSKDSGFDQFVDRVIAVLQRALEDDAFDRLMLIAPSQMLSILRRNLTPHLVSRIIASLPMDLVKQSPQHIRAQIMRLAF